MQKRLFNARAAVDSSDVWITPRWLIRRLGPFDLDPCANFMQPWPCATNCYLEMDDGLSQEWCGMVWLNPPYGRSTGKWIQRLAEHGQGIALTFARTDTRMFFDHVWPLASALLFLRGRLNFYRPDGSLPINGFSAASPSVLIAYGPEARGRLFDCQDLGWLAGPSSWGTPYKSAIQ